MEISVSAQAEEFALSCLLGLALSLFYDLLRGLRRVSPRLTVPADLAFGGVFCWALLWFMLVPGQGQFRLYNFAGMFLGVLLWFLTAGPVFLRGWVRVLQTIRRFLSLIFRPFTKFFKKFQKIAKNTFLLP